MDDFSNVTAAVIVLNKQTVMTAMSFAFAEAVVVMSLLHFLLSLGRLGLCLFL